MTQFKVNYSLAHVDLIIALKDFGLDRFDPPRIANGQGYREVVPIAVLAVGSFWCHKKFQV